DAVTASGSHVFESPWGRARPLEGRTALVTGAGRGIGRGVAEELSAAGCSVVCADLDPATARETVELLEGHGEAAQGEVSDAASVADLFGSRHAARILWGVHAI